MPSHAITGFSDDNGVQAAKAEEELMEVTFAGLQRVVGTTINI